MPISFVYYTIQTEDLNTGKTTDDVYVYITSFSNVALCADIIRGHWAVENLLHFHLDVNFYEDSVEIVDRVAFQNFSLLNKMAFSLTKLIAPFLKKNVRLTKNTLV
jgi:predicted transposase YbfD/YdcC